MIAVSFSVNGAILVGCTLSWLNITEHVYDLIQLQWVSLAVRNWKLDSPQLYVLFFLQTIVSGGGRGPGFLLNAISNNQDQRQTGAARVVGKRAYSFGSVLATGPFGLTIHPAKRL